MSNSAERLISQLFSFRVPNLPEWALAVTLPQVAGVTRLPSIMPVPFAPVYVRGICWWQERIVTVVDLGMAISGAHNYPSNSWPVDSQMIVAQIASGDAVEYAAWPISGEAGRVRSDSESEQMSIPPEFNARLVHVAFRMGSENLALLDLDGLYAGRW